ncbi:hypothetical protein [Kitasatospora griseola]|uniref:hypothetical protein n=1 Tax=Kitasatospora griseola TaxID=2064 RepID=UPI00364B651F
MVALGDGVGGQRKGLCRYVINAFVTLQFAVPPNAGTVTLKFRMYDAGNNWYWAVDHVRLDVRPISG